MRTLIKNATVYDGKGGKLTNSSILFDEKILAVGNDLENMPHDITIDGTGKTVMPGLIDLHIHITRDGARDFRVQQGPENRAEFALTAYRNAYLFIKNGITAVRNCGSKYDVDLEVRDIIDSGYLMGPRIFGSGEHLTMTGGHGHMTGIECDGIDEVTKAARLQIKKGADMVKLMATGGGMTKGVKPGASQLSEEEMRAAITEAKKTGKITAAHAQGNGGIKNAIRAGITTIEHGVEIDDETIKLMKEHNTYLVPTLAAPYHTVKNGVAAGIPDWAVKKNEEAVIPHRASFRLCLKEGIKIGTGTDAGTPFNKAGDLATEIEQMVLEGMSIRQVISAATSVGAEILQMQDSFGALEEGLLADIIIMNGDPEEEIRAFRSVETVFKSGKCLYNAEIAKGMDLFFNA